MIDSDLILSKLNAIENLKHKAVLTLTYSVGLRVSEIVNLKIEDIDSKRMIIHIKNAKGRKDRIVPLSQKVLDLMFKILQNIILLVVKRFTRIILILIVQFTH